MKAWCAKMEACHKAKMEAVYRSKMEQLQHLLQKTKLDPSVEDFSPSSNSSLKRTPSKYLSKQSPIAAPKKHPIHFLSLTQSLRRHIIFTALDMYGYQEDQAMLKSLRKITEVETDFEHAKKKWFKKMGICGFCEARCGWDESDYGSTDALEEDFDLQAFKFGRV